MPACTLSHAAPHAVGEAGLLISVFGPRLAGSLTLARHACAPDSVCNSQVVGEGHPARGRDNVRRARSGLPVSVSRSLPSCFTRASLARMRPARRVAAGWSERTIRPRVVKASQPAMRSIRPGVAMARGRVALAPTTSKCSPWVMLPNECLVRR